MHSSSLSENTRPQDECGSETPNGGDGLPTVSVHTARPANSRTPPQPPNALNRRGRGEDRAPASTTARTPRSQCGVRDMLGSKLLGEPSSSRFRGDVITQKGREAPASPRLFGFHRKGSAMTQVGCPNCRLRFTRAASAYLVACPECGRPPQAIVDAQRVVGFRLFVVEDVPQERPEALAVEIPFPDPGAGRS